MRLLFHQQQNLLSEYSVKLRKKALFFKKLFQYNLRMKALFFKKLFQYNLRWL